MAKKVVETPLMKQYVQMKAKHPDAVLLFRGGDFYETFSDDAIAASEILGITLTKRANGAASSVELAGFPHHALDAYLPKLVRAGKRVAICEQLEDPRTVKNRTKSRKPHRAKVRSTRRSMPSNGSRERRIRNSFPIISPPSRKARTHSAKHASS